MARIPEAETDRLRCCTPGERNGGMARRGLRGRAAERVLLERSVTALA